MPVAAGAVAGVARRAGDLAALTVLQRAALAPWPARGHAAQCLTLARLVALCNRVSETPITGDTGRVLCESTLIHRGRTVATADGRVLAEETGKLLAHGTTTCLLFSA